MLDGATKKYFPLGLKSKLTYMIFELILHKIEKKKKPNFYLSETF